VSPVSPRSTKLDFPRGPSPQGLLQREAQGSAFARRLS
jgi:hypothetical protein